MMDVMGEARHRGYILSLVVRGWMKMKKMMGPKITADHVKTLFLSNSLKMPLFHPDQNFGPNAAWWFGALSVES